VYVCNYTSAQIGSANADRCELEFLSPALRGLESSRRDDSYQRLLLVGAMAAAASAAVASPEMVGFGKNDEAGFEVEVASLDRQGLLWAQVAGKFFNAAFAEARFVFEFARNLVEQFLGNFHFRAPAWPFVGAGCAKLTLVGLTAQRTV
jgi:hypothetical protein